MSAAVTELAAHVQSRSGIVLGADKAYLIEMRLAPLMAKERVPTLSALAHELQGGRNERLSKAVVEALTTNESLFFRDRTPFDHLRTTLLPALVRARPAGQRLRMWSAAASTGQEAYSMAITAADVPGVAERGVEIVGTDIAAAPLERARAGIFSAFEVQRGLDGAHLARWFQREGDQWRAVPKLRAMVSFREWNLLSNLSPLGQFDVIFCRNVLIYFDAATKTRVLAAIGRQLAPDGLIYLGASETTLGIAPQLRRVAPGAYSVT
jgi:chemotaxis protein methyltransferase CheR